MKHSKNVFVFYWLYHNIIVETLAVRMLIYLIELSISAWVLVYVKCEKTYNL